ncbi:MAG: 30S ribosomal protein S4 [Dehalococcoidia bacterium]
MARYTGPVCRICRRYSEKLMLKGDKCVTRCTLDKRPSPPGATQTRRRKASDRALQLREKQKARYTYGVLEAQFRSYYQEAVRRPGVTGENLVQLLETRLDSMVLRMGFADSLAQGRQLVRHGHIMINGRKTNVPSARTKPGDVIAWTASGKKSEIFKVKKESMASKHIAGWLNVDIEQMTGRVVSVPTVTEAGAKFDPSVIVEFYSR